MDPFADLASEPALPGLGILPPFRELLPECLDLDLDG